MSPQEVAALVAKIRLFDNREVTHEVLVLWVDIFAPVTATVQDAYEAFLMHTRESTTYTQPAHIITNLRRLNEQRNRGHAIESDDDRPGTFVPDPKPANLAAMSAAWDDPVRLGIEVAKYREQVSDYHAHRRDTAPRGDQ